MWRGRWPAIGCLLLASCASQAKSMVALSSEGAPYDPAGEWTKDAKHGGHSITLVSHARAPARVQAVAEQSPEPPARTLRPFSNDELERLARGQAIVRSASLAPAG